MLAATAVLVGCVEPQAPAGYASPVPATPIVAATPTYVSRFTAEEVKALFLGRQLCLSGRCQGIGRWLSSVGGNYGVWVEEPIEGIWFIVVRANCRYAPEVEIFLGRDAGCQGKARVAFHEDTGIFTSDSPYGKFLLGEQ
jgi:hypothetical protein